jgi:formylglycine-generating enzyme required for sulfatase activity
MARKVLWTCVICLLGAAAAARAESPEVMFQKLYGDDAAVAGKAPTTKASLGFAARLVYNANNPQSDPALVRLLLEKAYELGCKSAQGAATAILAARTRMDQEAKDKQPWREKLLAACRIGYQKSNVASDKAQAAETLICELEDVSDDLSEAGNFAEALKLLKEGRQVAMAVQSSRQADLAERLRAVNGQTDVEKTFAACAKNLADNPQNAGAARAAVLMCVTQRDRPADAVQYVNATGDETLKKMVPLASEDMDKLSADSAGDLAAWYQCLAKKANRPNKVALLKRARKYYRKVLEKHSDDAQGKKVHKQMDDIARELGTLAPAGREMILDLGKGAKMRLVRMAPGKFLMGGPGMPDTRHPVIISKAFYMGATGVTQQQYEAVMGNNPARFKGPRDPVECVTWQDAVDFCRKLSDKCDCLARLPTDAQREYACRAGSQTAYCFGEDVNTLDEYAWFRGNHLNNEDWPHPVGQKKPNAWGLYDMHGNLYEWCSDWFDDWGKKRFTQVPVTDPTGPESGEMRVQRGAVWSSSTSDACQSSLRTGSDPTWGREWVGFRIIVEAPASSTKAPG